MPVASEVEEVYEQHQEVKAVDMGRRIQEKESFSYSNPAPELDKQPPTFQYQFNGRLESGNASGSVDKERTESKITFGGSTSTKLYSSYTTDSVDTEERVQKTSPPRRKAFPRDEKSEKVGSWMRRDGGGPELSTTSYKQQNVTSSSNTNNIVSRQYEPEPVNDGQINAILEVSN